MNSGTTEMLLMAVGYEVGVFFAVLAGFLIWRGMKGKKADHSAAHELVKNVKENEKSRRESLLQVFGECYDMEDEELTLAVDEFLNRERAFYKTMISVYVNHDAGEFSKLSVALQEMVKPYSDLALSADPAVDDGKLEALQQQNEELGKELNDSKKVMDELLSEYTATFDKEGDGSGPDAIKVTPNASEPSEIDGESSESEIVADNVEELNSETGEEESDDLEGTLELTVDVFTEEEGEDQSEDPETLDLIVEDSHDIEVAAEEESVSVKTEMDSEEEVIEAELNEVSLDEFDEELESEAV